MDNSRTIRTAIAVFLVCALGAGGGPRALAGGAGLRAPTIALAPGAGAAEGEEGKKVEDKKRPEKPSTGEGVSTNAAEPGQPQQGSQSQQTTIIVAGRTLTGPQSFPQHRGGRLLLPLAGIARALGDVVKVDSAHRTVEVRRQTGVVAAFDGQLNQVSENGSLILTASSTADIVFPPNADELMLPVEIVAALLDVAINLDEAGHAVRVTRGRAQAEASVRAGARRSSFELYQVEYEYNFNKYTTSSNQSLTLRADGRINDGRFSLLTNSSAGAGGRAGWLRNATFTYDRPNGQHFVAGDFGTGTDLLFMSSTLRGVSAQIPVRDLRVTAFAGRTVSGFVPTRPLFPFVPDAETPELIEQGKLRYDTSVFGASATFGQRAGTPYKPGRTLFSAGMIGFRGPGRRGEMFTASARYASTRGHFQGDVGLGRFSGTRSDGSRANGIGLAADLSASYDLRDNLTVQGRYTYVGANFLGPQEGLHEPVRLVAGGVTWRPLPWLSSSVTGSFASRPDAFRQRERFLTATFNVTPRGPWPTLFVSHTQSAATQAGGGAYTLVNASKDFARWRLFVNATRVKTAGPAFLNAQFGAHVRLGEDHTLQLSQSFGSRGLLGGAADWRTQSLLGGRASVGAGFSYQRAAGAPLQTSERLFVTARLPGRSTVQFTYLHGPMGPQYLLSLRGPLLRTRRAEAMSAATLPELDAYGSFGGRVYQDVNLDGRFDEGVDKPLANVRIRVDGSRYVVSDEAGRYRIDGVRAGLHDINLDLLSVRADLTLLDDARQAATLVRGRDSIVDFRLVRTGRVTGTVWLDVNGNKRLDEGERPLADVRVVTGSGRDTLTDENGVFVIGDLPPGTHAVLVDEKTLPDKTVSALGTLSVTILAGSETGEVNFAVTPAPPEIKRFSSAAN